MPMADLKEIIDSLEDKIGKLLHKQKLLEEKNRSLEQKLVLAREQAEEIQSKIADLENRNQTLKAANAILGSNEHKRETKLRINGLIREIDQCIVQLSE
jgi:hypothetical protein